MTEEQVIGRQKLEVRPHAVDAERKRRNDEIEAAIYNRSLRIQQEADQMEREAAEDLRRQRRREQEIGRHSIEADEAARGEQGRQFTKIIPEELMREEIRDKSEDGLVAKTHSGPGPNQQLDEPMGSLYRSEVPKATEQARGRLGTELQETTRKGKETEGTNLKARQQEITGEERQAREEAEAEYVTRLHSDLAKVGLSEREIAAMLDDRKQGNEQHRPYMPPLHQPPPNPVEKNPPCNTLYVGNLPADASEDEIKRIFSKQEGNKRIAFRTKQNGPMCFVEFEDVPSATKALRELDGYPLQSSTKGGIRLSFSRNPLAVRSAPAASK